MGESEKGRLVREAEMAQAQAKVDRPMVQEEDGTLRSMTDDDDLVARLRSRSWEIPGYSAASSLAEKAANRIDDLTERNRAQAAALDMQAATIRAARDDRVRLLQERDDRVRLLQERDRYRNTAEAQEPEIRRQREVIDEQAKAIEKLYAQQEHDGKLRGELQAYISSERPAWRAAQRRVKELEHVVDDRQRVVADLETALFTSSREIAKRGETIEGLEELRDKQHRTIEALNSVRAKANLFEKSLRQIADYEVLAVTPAVAAMRATAKQALGLGVTGKPDLMTFGTTVEIERCPACGFTPATCENGDACPSNGERAAHATAAAPNELLKAMSASAAYVISDWSIVLQPDGTLDIRKAEEFRKAR